MKRQLLLGGLLIATLCAWNVYGEDKHEHAAPKIATNAGFEKMKSLVGTWVKVGDDGKATDEVFSVIKLTAGGSAVQETFAPGTDMEMVSMYTADGDKLVMTHYCMLGNQPRMKADAKTVGKEMKFEFDGGGNLDPKKDAHMHGATFKFIDDDHLEIEGVAWANGAPSKEMCGTQKITRKK